MQLVARRGEIPRCNPLSLYMYCFPRLITQYNAPIASAVYNLLKHHFRPLLFLAYLAYTDEYPVDNILYHYIRTYNMALTLLFHFIIA